MTNWEVYKKIKSSIHDSARESKISLFELIGILTMLQAELVEAGFEADKDPDNN